MDQEAKQSKTKNISDNQQPSGDSGYEAPETQALLFL
jgi:hypothetical protein